MGGRGGRGARLVAAFCPFWRSLSALLVQVLDEPAATSKGHPKALPKGQTLRYGGRAGRGGLVEWGLRPRAVQGAATSRRRAETPFWRRSLCPVAPAAFYSGGMRAGAREPPTPRTRSVAARGSAAEKTLCDAAPSHCCRKTLAGPNPPPLRVQTLTVTRPEPATRRVCGKRTATVVPAAPHISRNSRKTT